MTTDDDAGSPEGEAVGVVVPPDNLTQVVHKLILVARLQVVQPGEDIAAGTPRDCHPVGGRITEGFKYARPPFARCQQHPALVCVPGKVPLPFRAPETARRAHSCQHYVISTLAAVIAIITHFSCQRQGASNGLQLLSHSVSNGLQCKCYHFHSRLCRSCSMRIVDIHPH